MRINRRPINQLRTHEGAPAIPQKGIDALRRMVSSCMLFEQNFYIDGKSAADRIQEIAATVPVHEVAALAIEARTVMNLRHVALWLTLAVIDRRVGSGYDTANLIAEVCRRADEPGELLAMYWKDGRKPVPAAMKRGLARAMLRHDAYALAKYDRPATVRIKDVLRISHPKAANDEQSANFGKILTGTIEAPDTWEVELSGGADKKQTFERLLREGKLGYLALLRNLRNMDQAGVNSDLVRKAILARKGANQVLPFRYVAAARAAPRYEASLDEALCAAIASQTELSGDTIILVDVSGSMNDKLSSKSDMTRMDAAATLASIIHGNVRMFSFSEYVKEVPARRGMAGVDAIRRSQAHMGTYLGKAVREINQIPHERLIVVTDEQSADVVPEAKARHAYMINVAAYEHAIGYGDWIRISGFSENVLNWIHTHEAEKR